MRHNFFKMASANVSKIFHQFGLVATLLLQHGLLYVDITYRHHVNKRLSIYYAVKRTIAQKFNPRCRVNSAKSNYMRISNPLNRVVPVCRLQQPESRQSGLARLPYIRSGLARVNSPHVIGP